MRPVRRLLCSRAVTLVLLWLNTLPTAGCSDTTSTPGAGAGGSSAGAGGRGGTGAGATSGAGGSVPETNGGASGEATNAGAPSEAGNGGAPDDDAPADVAGEYTVDLTTKSNSCSTDWRPGAQTTGVLFTIRQNGSALTAEAGGDAALSLVLLTGTNLFEGDIRGDAFTLTARGPTVFQTGSCNYTVDAIVAGTLHGDTIEGTLTYRPVVGSDPACAQYECEAVQDYVGTRQSS